MAKYEKANSIFMDAIFRTAAPLFRGITTFSIASSLIFGAGTRALKYAAKEYCYNVDIDGDLELDGRVCLVDEDSDQKIDEVRHDIKTEFSREFGKRKISPEIKFTNDNKDLESIILKWKIGKKILATSTSMYNSNGTLFEVVEDKDANGFTDSRTQISYGILGTISRWIGFQWPGRTIVASYDIDNDFVFDRFHVVSKEMPLIGSSEYDAIRRTHEDDTITITAYNFTDGRATMLRTVRYDENGRITRYEIERESFFDEVTGRPDGIIINTYGVDGQLEGYQEKSDVLPSWNDTYKKCPNIWDWMGSGYCSGIPEWLIPNMEQKYLY